MITYFGSGTNAIGHRRHMAQKVASRLAQDARASWNDWPRRSPIIATDLKRGSSAFRRMAPMNFFSHQSGPCRSIWTSKYSIRITLLSSIGVTGSCPFCMSPPERPRTHLSNGSKTTTAEKGNLSRLTTNHRGPRFTRNRNGPGPILYRHGTYP